MHIHCFFLISMVAGLCHFVFSRLKDASRKNENTPCEKHEQTKKRHAERRNNAMRKDETRHAKRRNFSGWLDDCDFTSFSTVFQSYQDDGWVIMKDRITAFTAGKISASSGGRYQGPVVQSIVSLTSSLRGQLVKCFS